MKKLSAALVEAIVDSDGAIGALANLLARGATCASRHVLSKLVAHAFASIHRLHRQLRLRDAGAVVDCGAVPVLAECLENEELRRRACAALRTSPHRIRRRRAAQ